MEQNPVSVKKIGIKYGLITAAICIAYFLIMLAAGLIHITALRLFNYAFLFAGIFLAFNEVTHKLHKHRVNYLPGIWLGYVITFISSAVFSLFVFIFCFIDKSFIDLIKPDLPEFSGNYLNPYIITVFVFGEMVAFGSVLLFIIMQFFKRNSTDMESVEEAREKGYY